ncbi:hypothetical protein I316_02910 [Kwoniella heveanensis BCC8398]|uniref:Uncharacterized protein n=1 Tax=Kwoniella heveanensis BCC8398 TaxID=1296120 RepID=A0A1B9GWG4_9TREE|nr:hypothetical protein I316_02910 [Kwoniella heveanensis BCC8398]
MATIALRAEIVASRSLCGRALERAAASAAGPSSLRYRSPRRGTQTCERTLASSAVSFSSAGSGAGAAAGPGLTPLQNDPQWPWRPIPITKFEKRFSKSRMPPDPASSEGQRPTATEYRIIFSRPLPSSPWKRILLATGLTWLGCVWFVIPDKPRVEGLEDEDVGYGRYIAGTTANFLLDQVPFIALAGAVLSLNKTLRLLRVVTRLEQVQAPAQAQAHPSPSTAALQGGGSTGSSAIAGGSAGNSRVWVKMWTGRSALDGLVPSKKEYRDIEVADVGLSGVRSAQGPVLDLKISPSPSNPTSSQSLKVSSSSRDRRPYWMDLRDSPKDALDAEKSGKDYVVSLNRLQQVFGKVDFGN